MKRKKHKLRKKLGDSKGETLAEALVASLLAGIALLFLASMIMVSHRMIDRSSNGVTAFYEDANQIENQTVEPKDGHVTLISSDHTQTQINVKIYKTDSGLAVYTN